MKCLCGYEYDKNFDKEIVKGDEEFIEVDGHFTVDVKQEYCPTETIKVSIFACPKCKTLRTDEVI